MGLSIPLANSDKEKRPPTVDPVVNLSPGDKETQTPAPEPSHSTEPVVDASEDSPTGEPSLEPTPNPHHCLL